MIPYMRSTGGKSCVYRYLCNPSNGSMLFSRKRFGGNPVLGMVIGAIMLDSSLANAYQAAQGTVDIEVIRLFGLKIEMVGFQEESSSRL